VTELVLIRPMSDTSAEKDDPDVVRAYAILGLCATQFSALEFHIQFLLSFLHMGHELAVETVVFTRRLTFYQKADRRAYGEYVVYAHIPRDILTLETFEFYKAFKAPGSGF
jgi:hypothetical protein